MIRQLIHRLSVSSVLAAPVFGLVLLVSGCGGDGGARELTPVDKQNIADEMKAAEDAKKNKEVRVNPGA